MNHEIRVRLQAVRSGGLHGRFIEDWIVYAMVALDLAIRRAAIALISGGGTSSRRPRDSRKPLIRP